MIKDWECHVFKNVFSSHLIRKRHLSLMLHFLYTHSAIYTLKRSKLLKIV